MSASTKAEAEARARLISVDSYALSLDLTAAPEKVRSRADVRFACRQPGAETFADLSVRSPARLVLNGAPVGADAFLPDGRVRLTDLRASNNLIFEGDVRPAPGRRGLANYSDVADGADYLLGYTYPTFAPDLFCCFDQRDLLGSLELEVIAPAGWECISHGQVVERPEIGDAGSWRFATVEAINPSDFTLCAGPYALVDQRLHTGPAGDLPIRVWCRRSLAGSVDLTRSATVIAKTIAFYEEILGVPCPSAKYDIVFVPDLNPVAAQFQALMLVNENLLHRVADEEDDFVTMVLAHEVAHLWFGCLVEGRWWDDLWLSEALATNLSYVAGEAVLDMRAPWAEFAMQGKSDAYRADTLPSTEAVASPVERADVALTRPTALTYSKGASIVRQLTALIGDGPMKAGLGSYLRDFAGGPAQLADLLERWSTASGRDLGGWADDWLLASGANTLRAVVERDGDGSVAGLSVRQVGEPLRTHRVDVATYELHDGHLRLRSVVPVEASGPSTDVPELAGGPLPDAVIVNHGDLTFARLRFDDSTWAALSECALDVGDPVTESVCWNAALDMMRSGELAVGYLIRLVVRRAEKGGPAAGVASLLRNATFAADFYARPAIRRTLRRELATAAIEGIEHVDTGRRAAHEFAVAFAAASESGIQLARLRAWLDGRLLPEGVGPDVDLRRQILVNLSAHDMSTDEDLDTAAGDDPVAGAEFKATCTASRPTEAGKEAGWRGALSEGHSPRLALAHARGLWVPGQEMLLDPYRARYFAEALPLLNGREPRSAQRLVKLLFPMTLVDDETFRATDGALADTRLSTTIRAALVEQKAVMSEIVRSRSLGPAT